MLYSLLAGHIKKHAVKFIIFFSISIIMSNAVAMFKTPLKSSCFRSAQSKEITQPEHIEKDQQKHQTILTKFKKHEMELEEVLIQTEEMDISDPETRQAKIEQIKDRDLPDDIKIERLKVLFTYEHIEYQKKFLEMVREGLSAYQQAESEATTLLDNLTHLEYKISKALQLKNSRRKVEEVKLEKETEKDKYDLDTLLAKSELIKQSIQRKLTLMNLSLQVSDEAIQKMEEVCDNILKLSTSEIAVASPQ